jgi:hypothetical protein
MMKGKVLNQLRKAVKRENRMKAKHVLGVGGRG